MNIVVLAAGEGTRMKAEGMPKVLVPIKEKPIVSYLVEAIKASGVDQKPTLVIGVHAEMVQNFFGDGCRYVIQKERLGTGHAVKVTRELLEPIAKDVMVFYGDHVLLSPETIRALAETHERDGNTLTMATTIVPHDAEWETRFKDFGRIIRSIDGTLEKIVEKKDATPEELASREVNPGYYCIKASWLWPALENLKPANAQGEYYITDLLQQAVEQKEKIGHISIKPKEALGINTKEQLAMVEALL